MRLIVLFLATFLMSSAMAYVNSSLCPSEITIVVSDVKKVELNAVIENDFFLRAAWEKLEPVELYTETFKILTRSESALCVYVGNNKVAYLQTNNFQDELMVIYDQNQTTYFRFRIEAFSPNHIEFLNAELNLFAPIYVIGGDSVSQIGEEGIATAHSVSASVLP